MTRNLTLQACALNIAGNEKGDAAQNRAASPFLSMKTQRRKKS